MLKLHKQCKDEGLDVSLSDICYESCMAQNLMLEYAGGTPQLALTGQHPTGLTPDTETLASITGALEPRPDYIETLYRTRLLAKQAIIQSLIQERLTKATTMKQHAHKPSTLLPGTICDIWRQPDRKDEDGWRGPAEIISIERLAGSAIVKHQGQPLIVPLHHIRKHALQDYFLTLIIQQPDTLKRAFDF